MQKSVTISELALVDVANLFKRPHRVYLVSEARTSGRFREWLHKSCNLEQVKTLLQRLDL
jgi:hypothetical protein